MEYIVEEIKYSRQFTPKHKLEEFYVKLEEIIQSRDLENTAYESIGYFFHCLCVPVNAIPPAFISVESTSVEKEKRIRGTNDITMVTAGEGMYTPLGRHDAPTGTWFMASLFDGKLPEKLRNSNARLKIPIPRLMWYLSNVLQFQPLHTLGVPVKEENVGKKVNQYAVEMELPGLFLEHVHHDSVTHVRLVLVRKGTQEHYWCEEHLKKLDLFNNPILKYQDSSWKTIKSSRALDPRFYVEIFVVGDVDLQSMIYTWEPLLPYNTPISGIHERRKTPDLVP